MTAPEILAAAPTAGSARCGSRATTGCAARPTARSPSRRSSARELVIVSDLFLTETARRAHVVFAAAAFASARARASTRAPHPARGARARAARGTRTDLDIFIASRARWARRGATAARGRVPRDRAARARLRGHELGDAAAARAPVVAPDAGAGGALARPRTGARGRAEGGLWLLSGGTLFLQGSLSHRTELLPRLAKPARAFLAAATRSARRSPKATAWSSRARGRIRLPVALDDSVAPGCVFVPYAFPGVELNRLGAPAARACA
jgi:hypothetical protein